jgi:peptidoglycan/xylan/chitin deacetylase (PgdA/CDA1 family)
MVHAPSRAVGVDYGALVISLDFELHWGVRDRRAPDGSYRANLVGERAAVPAILGLFTEFDIRATWAAVGFLFARTRDDVERFSPTIRPAYVKRELSPYDEPLGAGEEDDPLHYARSLVDLISATPGQEVATHTFSHYYCLEPGQDASTFRCDLESAIAIAKHQGTTLHSLVFPRNQASSEHVAVAQDLGLSAYRGNQLGSVYKAAVDEHQESSVRRARRLLDAYVGRPGRALVAWDRVADGNGMANVAASRFLRPYSPKLRALEPLRRRRIMSALDRAARTNQIFHMWWHPHNFGTHLDENLAFLRAVLERFAVSRESFGMRSMTMHDVADVVSAREA